MSHNKTSFIDLHKDTLKVRSTRPEVFCKKGVLKNFAKFTGKHLCRSLFFNKVTGLRSVRSNFEKIRRVLFYQINLMKKSQ